MWMGRRSVLRQRNLLLQRRLPLEGVFWLPLASELQTEECVAVWLCWLAGCRYVLDADSPGTLDPTGSHK